MNWLNLWNFIVNHPYLLGLTLLTLSVLLYEETMSALASKWMISAGEAVELINHHNPVVLDLRDVKSFQNGHIFKAKQINHKQLSAHLQSGNRNQIFILVLAKDSEFWQIKKQFPADLEGKIKILQGGIIAWRDAGLPLVK